jgi:serine O-acetyltransferase
MRRLFQLPLLLGALFRAPWRTALADARRWCEVENVPFRGAGSVLDELRKPEFRSLFYYRMSHAGGLARVFARFASVFYRPQVALYLHADEIGEGLYILHGFSTIVVARRLGRNCWINQQVTIGYRDGTAGPILEDGVRVYAGAKVLGPITIGANTRIGANAVVLHDAPADCTLVGVPARIARRAGNAEEEGSGTPRGPLSS